MPLCLRLSPAASVSCLQRACRQGCTVELSTPFDHHRQLHATRFAAVDPQRLAVVLPPALVPYQSLMWKVRFELSFQLPAGWFQLHAATPPDSCVGRSPGGAVVLRLVEASRLTLLKNPEYLSDSFPLEHPVPATLRFDDAQVHLPGPVSCRLRDLGSAGAACLIDLPLHAACHPGREVAIVLPLPNRPEPLRLNGCLSEIVPLDGSEALLLVAFEQASRHQAHRDNMAVLAAFMQDRWGPPAPSPADRPLAPAATKSLQGPQAVLQLLREPFRCHAVAAVDQPGQTDQSLTRLLEIQNRCLVLQTPPTPILGSAPALQPGQALAVSFIHRQRLVRFCAILIRQDHCHLPGVGQLPALLLRLPDEVSVHQQRSAFRTRLAVWPPLEACLCPAGAHESLKQARSGRPRTNAVIRDISAGGVAVQAKPRSGGLWDPAQAAPDQFVWVALHLQPDQPPVTVPAQVKHARRDPASGALLIGLEFIGLETTLQGRALKNRLEHFAAQIQRRQLAKRGHH